MIKIDHIYKKFIEKDNTVSALNDITFTIGDGEIFGIVGKSGAGKSTLLKILSLQLKPDAGSIEIDSKLISNEDETSIRKMIQKTGYIFQNFNLLYNKTVLDNVALPLQLQGVKKQERYEKALSMLNFVGLSDKANNYPITLSGGEAQRVAIARALINSPTILFCDEPTSALDEDTALEILNLLKRIHEVFKPTMIFVSHQLSVIQYMCDKALLLDRGHIMKLGSIKKLKTFLINTIDTIWEEQEHV